MKRLERARTESTRYLSSLQDVSDSLVHCPVVSSLRSSTTGYHLSSLQLDLAYREASVWGQMVNPCLPQQADAFRLANPEGITENSRGLSEATPTET